MPEVVISDTSILILFHKIDEFDLLIDVYGELKTTPEIAAEFGEHLPNWIRIQPVSDKKYQDFLTTMIDEGEASALALATEYKDKDVLILVDDLKARNLAANLEFRITGSLGIINKAKQMKIIPAVKPLI